MKINNNLTFRLMHKKQKQTNKKNWVPFNPFHWIQYYSMVSLLNYHHIVFFSFFLILKGGDFSLTVFFFRKNISYIFIFGLTIFGTLSLHLQLCISSIHSYNIQYTKGSHNNRQNIYIYIYWMKPKKNKSVIIFFVLTTKSVLLLLFSLLWHFKKQTNKQRSCVLQVSSF